MQPKEITVFCVCVGEKYDSAYVYALKEAVEKHLTLPHRFKCITTRKLEGVETVLPPVPYQSWWSKISLFYPGIATGPTIYLDLDVVITGNIDFLADLTDTFSAPANWAQSGHGGIQSSVMCWPGNWHLPFEKFNYEIDSERLWGDQEFLWELLGDDWQHLPLIGSYKYHIRPTGIIPEWMRIACFHGLPNPEDVDDKCLKPYITRLKELLNER